MKEMATPLHTQPKMSRASISPAALEDALMALIGSKEYAPGDRLPTERALAERYGVTRGAIRAALGRIEGRGRIVRVVGSGTYIAGPSTAIFSSNQARDASPQEIMEARLLIEPQLPLLVVAHANGADLEEIRIAMEGAEKAKSLDDFEAWDGRFHQAIANATHNSLVIAIYQMVTAARNIAEWGALKRRNATRERRAEREAEHKAIFEALQSRDAAAAQQAFDLHLHKVKRNLLS